MICLCKIRTTSRATLIVVILLQLCQATLVTDDPEYIYLLPNVFISKCGPDILWLVLVEEETLSDLHSYIPFVALQAFCKWENGLCRQSNITLASTEKKEQIKMRMGMQTNCSGRPAYDNNVCTLKMEAKVYGGDPEFYNDTFTCKAFQEMISPVTIVNTTQLDFMVQTSTNAEMSVPQPPDTSTLSDVSVAVVGSTVPAILLFLLLFTAILLLSMILFFIRRDKKKMRIPPNTKSLFSLTLDNSTMNSETFLEDEVTIYDTLETDYSRLKSPDRMVGNTSIQCISHDCQSQYLSGPEDSCNYVHLKNNVRSNSLS